MIAAHRKEEPSLCQALHDMSQPLTRLQWRLELGRRGGEADLRDAVEGALADSLELIDWLRHIRTTIEVSEGKAA